MKALVDWLDSRTGVRGFVHEALYERIPGGARWRYVWGSTLVFAFAVQTITGIVLWMYYSPSAQTAWESVYYIQHEASGGWLLRGIHHFMAQAMVVLLALHLLQVVIDGAYRAPREVNFWLGLILMQIVLGLSLTGYLLPWDQKGYWATRVATNLLGVVPGVGTHLQYLVVGGADYGHHTLTRFFALHAGVLPGLLVAVLVVHVALFRRHGICYKRPEKYPETTFWPDQVLKDSVACLAVLVLVLVLCLRPFSWFSAEGGMAFGPQAGAELGAPADPSNQYSAARPEWYFLFLFQFLKLFEGYGEQGELLGAVVIPSLVMLALFLMPLVGRWNLGHRFNIALLVILFGGIGWLTWSAIHEDYQARWTDPEKFAELRPTFDELGLDQQKITEHFGDEKAAAAEYREQARAYERYRKSEDYLKSVADAELEAERVVELASGPRRIPLTGAISLLREDAKTQGPRLFASRCATCHTYLSPSTDKAARDAALAKAVAPNLHGFADRKWLAGFLSKHIADPEYFGNTAHKEGQMVGFVNDTMSGWEQADVENVVIALSAEAQLPAQREADAKDSEKIAAGRKLIEGEENCVSCHKFHDTGELGGAPDLTGYGSREWLVGMISDPNHQRFYPDTNDGMPAFAEHPGDSSENILSREAIGLVVDWLRGEWYEPAHAAETAASKPAAAPQRASASQPEPKVDPPQPAETPKAEEPSAEPEAKPPAEPEAKPPAEPEAKPAEASAAPAAEPAEAPAEPGPQ
jgi:ubiquinol-cytochrome c reductase cytochrome b subunit